MFEYVGNTPMLCHPACAESKKVMAAMNSVLTLEERDV